MEMAMRDKEAAVAIMVTQFRGLKGQVRRQATRWSTYVVDKEKKGRDKAGRTGRRLFRLEMGGGEEGRRGYGDIRLKSAKRRVATLLMKATIGKSQYRSDQKAETGKVIGWLPIELCVLEGRQVRAKMMRRGCECGG